MKPYLVTGDTDQGNPFVEPRRMFNRLVTKLQGDETARMDHGKLEEFLRAESAGIIRQLLQSHLDLRAQREKKQSSVVGEDGVVRTHVRRGSRPLETIFGRVVVTRLLYRQAGVTSIAPMDADLRLPDELYSDGLMRCVAREAAKGSFDEVVESVSVNTGGRVPKRQAEQLARRAASAFDAFYGQRAATEPEGCKELLLVMSVDGKGVVMRKEDLREETRKRAEASKHKLKKRVTRGEVRNRKRDATVAAIYSVAAKPRTAEQVMSGLGPDPEGEKHRQPHAQNKRVWASMEEPEQVLEELFAEAHRRDPLRERRWVILVDGDRRQLRRIRAALKKHALKVTLALDFIHVLERLWASAYAIHGEGTPAAEQWVQERATEVLKGKSSNVAAGIRRSATLRGLTGQQRKIVDRCANYLLKYRDMLRYDEYLAAGMPIATGVVEGACRHVVKDRMEVTGARWSLAGAEAILRLRSLKASHDWGAYWAFYEQHAGCTAAANDVADAEAAA